jgi:hypothetical protein
MSMRLLITVAAMSACAIAACGGSAAGRTQQQACASFQLTARPYFHAGPTFPGENVSLEAVVKDNSGHPIVRRECGVLHRDGRYRECCHGCGWRCSPRYRADEEHDRPTTPLVSSTAAVFMREHRYCGLHERTIGGDAAVS